MTRASSPIGGTLISPFGGSLGFVPFQGILPAAGVAPPTTDQTLLDVARGVIAQKFTVDDTTHSGSFAARGASIVCEEFTCVARVKWDITNPPNFLAGLGAQLASRYRDYGYQLWFYMSAQDNFGDVQPYYWYCPSCKGSALATISEAAARKRVEAEIEIVSNAPLFALGGTISDLLAYNQYIAHCQSRNWVW